MALHVKARDTSNNNSKNRDRLLSAEKFSQQVLDSSLEHDYQPLTGHRRYDFEYKTQYSGGLHYPPKYGTYLIEDNCDLMFEQFGSGEMLNPTEDYYYLVELSINLGVKLEWEHSLYYNNRHTRPFDINIETFFSANNLNSYLPEGQPTFEISIPVQKDRYVNRPSFSDGDNMNFARTPISYGTISPRMRAGRYENVSFERTSGTFQYILPPGATCQFITTMEGLSWTEMSLTLNAEIFHREIAKWKLRA